jgi:hypothetical protein
VKLRCQKVKVMGRRMRPLNAIRLLCSGKYKRTPCILHTSLSSTLQVYKGVWKAPVIGRQTAHTKGHSPHYHTPPPRDQNVRTLRSPAFSPTGTAKWPRPETDREVTNVRSYNCWRYLSGVTLKKRQKGAQRVAVPARSPVSVRLY